MREKIRNRPKTKKWINEKCSKEIDRKLKGTTRQVLER